MDIKMEIKEELWTEMKFELQEHPVSDIGLQNEMLFLSSDCIKASKFDHDETDVKVESCWTEDTAVKCKLENISISDALLPNEIKNTDTLVTGIVGDLPPMGTSRLDTTETFSEYHDIPQFVSSTISEKGLKLGKTVCKDTSNNKKPYICRICNKSFSYLSELKNHKLAHENSRPFKCKFCDKTFKSIYDVRKHNVIHEDKRLYKCNICEKSFNRMSHLQHHKLVHEEHRPHKCETCGKSFKWLYALKKHKIMHEDIRLYKCEICEKSFKRASNLHNHKLVHDEQRQYKCEICERSFKELYTLKKHNISHYGK